MKTIKKATTARIAELRTRRPNLRQRIKVVDKDAMPVGSRSAWIVKCRMGWHFQDVILVCTN
jgi:hypothetical protein